MGDHGPLHLIQRPSSLQPTKKTHFQSGNLPWGLHFGRSPAASPVHHTHNDLDGKWSCSPPSNLITPTKAFYGNHIMSCSPDSSCVPSPLSTPSRFLASENKPASESHKKPLIAQYTTNTVISAKTQLLPMKSFNSGKSIRSIRPPIPQVSPQNEQRSSTSRVTTPRRLFKEFFNDSTPLRPVDKSFQSSVIRTPKGNIMPFWSEESREQGGQPSVKPSEPFPDVSITNEHPTQPIGFAAMEVPLSLRCVDNNHCVITKSPGTPGPPASIIRHKTPKLSSSTALDGPRSESQSPVATCIQACSTPTLARREKSEVQCPGIFVLKPESILDQASASDRSQPPDLFTVLSSTSESCYTSSPGKSTISSSCKSTKSPKSRNGTTSTQNHSHSSDTVQNTNLTPSESSGASIGGRIKTQGCAKPDTASSTETACDSLQSDLLASANDQCYSAKSGTVASTENECYTSDADTLASIQDQCYSAKTDTLASIGSQCYSSKSSAATSAQNQCYSANADTVSSTGNECYSSKSCAGISTQDKCYSSGSGTVTSFDGSKYPKPSTVLTSATTSVQDQCFSTNSGAVSTMMEKSKGKCPSDELCDSFSGAEKCCPPSEASRERSNSVLHEQVQMLQRELAAKSDEVRQLRRLLDSAGTSLGVATLSDQLRTAKKETQEWKSRALVAEKQMEALTQFSTVRHSPSKGNGNKTDKLINFSDDYESAFNRYKKAEKTKYSEDGAVVQERIRKTLHGWKDVIPSPLGMDGASSGGGGYGSGQRFSSEDSTETVIRGGGQTMKELSML